MKYKRAEVAELVALIDAGATLANVVRQRPDLTMPDGLPMSLTHQAADWEYVVWLERDAARHG